MGSELMTQTVLFDLHRHGAHAVKANNERQQRHSQTDLCSGHADIWVHEVPSVRERRLMLSQDTSSKCVTLMKKKKMIKEY